MRAATADAHHALDRRFADGLPDRQRYTLYVLGMQRLVAAFESAAGRATAPVELAAWQTHPRTPLLNADLDALGASPLAPATVHLDEAGEWFGAQYVVEGSALGARTLLDSLQAAGAARPAETSFLQRHTRPDPGWREFLARLETRPDTELPAIIAGALRMFALAEDSFARAEDTAR